MAAVTTSSGNARFTTTKGVLDFAIGAEAFAALTPIFRDSAGKWFKSKGVIDYDFCDGIAISGCDGADNQFILLEFSDDSPTVISFGASSLTRMTDYFIGPSGGFGPKSDLTGSNRVVYFGTAISDSAMSIRPNRLGTTIT